MINSVRARLTLWYALVLAAVLVSFSAGVYGLLSRSLYQQLDANLLTAQQIAVTSLTNDAEEGQSVQGAAESTVNELFEPPMVLAIYDASGRLLAENGHDDELPPVPPANAAELGRRPLLYSEPEEPGDDDLRRVAVRSARIEPGSRGYVIVASHTLEPIEEELEALLHVFAYAIPAAIVLAAAGGWFLAKRSLAPAVAMAEQARRTRAEDLDQRLPVTNPHDELGRLAAAFNEFLDRLSEAFDQQRQFMADASHELRTPVSVLATAAEVTLAKERRDEQEYREALEIIREQTTRLGRIVEDMFTLARADAGRYPVQSHGFYLDELVAEVGRASAVLGRAKDVEVEVSPGPEAPITGDEDLLRQMLLNLAENAIKHTPTGGRVRIVAEHEPDEYVITVRDSGCGIPEEAIPYVFERFYRADPARRREESSSTSGAGLGLPIARWIAEAHGGALVLVSSGPHGTTFRATLPRDRA